MPYATPESAVNRNSEASQRANQRGLRLIDEGNDRSAETAFREALNLDLTNAAAHNNLGLLLLKQKKWYEASWEFAYAAKLQPNASAPRGNLGLVFESVGQHERAIESYDAALAIDPDDIQTMGHLARTLVKSDRPADRPRLRNLLETLALRAKPDWSDWARSQLLRLQIEPDERH